MLVEVRKNFVYIDGKPLPYRSTPNRGGVIKPEVLILHDTAGRLDGKSSISWMTNPAARASAHLFVDRNGKVTQLAALNIACWHAGKSAYKKRSGVNNFGIGIEIENPGIMTAGGPGCSRAWWKEDFSIPTHGIKRVKDADHPDGFWMPYTDAQLAAVEALSKAIVTAYSLKDVSTHYAISPKRKVDVNPLFPIERVRQAALGSRYFTPMGRA